MAQPAVQTAVCKCSFGAAPAPLTVTSQMTVAIGGMPAATILDGAGMVNVPTFGMCSNPANPTVAAATGFRFRHHEAGADAEAAAVVTQEMLRQSGCADLDALAQRLGICPGSVSPEGHFPCRAIPKRRRRNEGRPRRPS